MGELFGMGWASANDELRAGELVDARGVRITFGMIVLNGEPFTRYNLRSLYPWAHQIIVVEGACPGAASVARRDGHSADGTLEMIRRFKRDEDPEGKVEIVTAEDEGCSDGFWPGEKTQMSQAYARRANGNYLWQVDSDEFYLDSSMRRIARLLASGVDAITVPTLTFWGGMDYIANGSYLVRHRAGEYSRIFRWAPGYTYQSHRPPTVLDAVSTDLRAKRHVTADSLALEDIYLYHYSLLFPCQVSTKVGYYRNQGAEKDATGGGVNPDIATWADEVYGRLEKPFRVHNMVQHYSWLERFHGPQPEQALCMMEAVKAGQHPGVALRCNDDVEALLGARWYAVARRGLKARIKLEMAADTLVTGICRNPLYRSCRSSLGALLCR